MASFRAGVSKINVKRSCAEHTCACALCIRVCAYCIGPATSYNAVNKHLYADAQTHIHTTAASEIKESEALHTERKRRSAAIEFARDLVGNACKDLCDDWVRRPATVRSMSTHSP